MGRSPLTKLIHLHPHHGYLNKPGWMAKHTELCILVQLAILQREYDK